MMKHQYDLYTAAQTRELDRFAIAHTGVSGFELMQSAGRCVFEHIRRRWPNAARLAIFCGAGNNAGDGYIVAHLAHQAGLSVCVYCLAPAQRLPPDAAQARRQCETAGVDMRPFAAPTTPAADVIVDALFGSGLQRPLANEWAAAVDSINAAAAPVVAADLPSGIHADSGQVMGVAVRATLTVTFIGLKRGLFTGQAPAYCGEIVYDDLQVQERCYQAVTAGAALISDDVIRRLQPRRRSAHKNDYGHVLVVGGNAGMAGAAVLAAQAALRAGAGLVSVATKPAHVAAVVAAQPALMAHGVDDADELAPLLAKASVVVVGPGLGQDDWAKSLLGKVLENRTPTVCDADALNLLAAEPAQREHWVLTPHPGEAARLLDDAGVAADRFAAVEQLQRRYGGVAVLKGAGTLITAGGLIKVCRHGNPGMATAGTGDVLSGVIAALMAQGLPPVQAAELGVWLHATAGDLEAQAAGQRGMVATDLLARIRQALNVND